MDCPAVDIGGFYVKMLILANTTGHTNDLLPKSVKKQIARGPNAENVARP
jgi:hypothetical protein